MYMYTLSPYTITNTKYRLKHPDSWAYSNESLCVYDHAVYDQASLDIHNMVVHKEKIKLKKKFMCVRTCNVCTHQIYRFTFVWGPNQGVLIICESKGLNTSNIFSHNMGIPLANPLSALSYAHPNIFFLQMIYHTNYRYWISGVHGVSSNAFDIQLQTCTHGHNLDKYMHKICWNEHFYEPQRHTSWGTVCHSYHT